MRAACLKVQIEKCRAKKWTEMKSLTLDPSIDFSVIEPINFNY